MENSSTKTINLFVSSGLLASVSVHPQVCGGTRGKDNVKNQRNPSDHCPGFRTPALGDSSPGQLSRGSLSCLFMSHSPALSCLVASGGRNVIGGWVLQLQAKAPLLCCRVASSVQGPWGHGVTTEVSRGQGGTTVLLSGLGPLLVILSVPCGPAYAKAHDHFYPITAGLSVTITEWMSPVHQDWRSLLCRTQDHNSSRV